MNRTVVVALLVLVGLAALFFMLRPGPSQTGGPGEREIDLKVEDGVMTPDEIEVGEGDRVRIRVTSDEPIEIHVHGYDLEREVAPDEPATLSFEADLTGRFEIENHESEEVLGVLIVQPR